MTTHPPAARTRRRLFNAAAVLAATAVMAACGGSDDAPAPVPAPPPPAAPTPPSPPAPSPPPAVPAPVSATIGAAGGTINGPDGVQLVIPAGALAQDTVIRIARSEAGAPAALDEWTRAAPTIEITPHELQFAQPVTIRMPLAAPAGATEADVLVASPGGDWTAGRATVAGGMAELTRGTLSWYQPVSCAIPIGSTDPYPCNFVRENSWLATVPAGGPLTRTWASSGSSHWSLTQATTLRITSVYAAAPDCGNARVTIRRRNGGVGTPLTTLLDQGAAMSPQSTVRVGGSVTFDLPITSADNGLVALYTSLTCTRPGRAPRTDGYAHFVTVNAPATLAPPVISQQPADVSVNVGGNASFTVAATAADTLTIEWQQSTDNGQRWTAQGGTAATLALTGVSAADNGKRFRARVCNVAGAQSSCVESRAAQLTVITPAAGWLPPALIASPAGDEAAAIVPGNGTAMAAWTVAGPNGSRIVARRATFAGGWAGAPDEIDTGLPAGTSSFDPRLASAPNGQIVAVWGTFFGGRFGVAANRFDGSAWGTPTELVTTAASGDLRVAMDSSARAAAVWQQSSREVWLALDNGSTWSTPVNLNRNGASGSQPEVAVNAAGRGFVTFIEGATLVAVPIDLAAGSVGNGVTAAVASTSAADHRIAVDAAGGAVLAWFDGNDIRATRFAGGAWTPTELIAADVGFTREIQVGAGGADQAIVTWIGRDNPSGDDMVSSRQRVGNAWSAPLRSSTAFVRPGGLQLAMNAAGRIVLHWTYVVGGRAMAQVFDSTWRAAQAVENSTDPVLTQRAPGSMRTLSLGPDGNALLVWRESTASGNVLMGAFLQ
ncbi:MAG: hypothetical protein MUC68_04820 [Burkholderiaceae bacterium]|nr:hypothetical protein [Burkholderiaceae bacterium]